MEAFLKEKWVLTFDTRWHFGHMIIDQAKVINKVLKEAQNLAIIALV